jgi:hypothetical protein
MPRDLFPDEPAAPPQQKRAPRDLFAPPPTWGDIGTDVAKSLGSGVVSGTEVLAGLPGDLNELVGAGVQYAGRKLGLPDPPADTRPPTMLSQAVQATQLPTSQDIGSFREQNIGQLHTPETGYGQAAQTLGEFAPGMLAGPGGIVRRAVTQTVLPAAGSEAAGRLTEGTGYEPYARVAGAVLGAASPTAAARAITPFPASPARQAMAQTLANEGVTSLTAGQRTGSRGLKYFESEMGGGRTANLLENQGTEFTAAVLRRAGINADRATPPVMDQAFRRIGGDFDRLSAAANAPFDPQVQNDLLSAVTDYHMRGGVAPVVEQEMNNIAHTAQLNGGHITGDAYQTIRSRIGAHIRATDGPTQIALREIQESLDDAIERHMPAAHMDEWRQARRQYRNLLVIERAATGAGEDAAMGTISPAKLRQAAVGQNRRAYVRGTDDFSDLAHAGQAVMTPLPQSGTAPRMAAHGIANSTSAVVGAILGGHLGATEAGLGAVAGGLAPRGLGYLAMSRPGQAFLGNQMVRGPTGAGQNMARAALISALLERRRAAGQ